MADVTQDTDIAPMSAPMVLPDDVDRPELGHLARWHVSSHKYGFGIDNLRDNDENTFWQSEGPQPHLIDLTFPKCVSVSAVALRTSHPRDDSYTPSKVSVQAGTSVHDLQEVQVKEFQKPNGWIYIPLRPSGQEGDVDGPPIPCYHLRVLIIANHLNGKDTHVRGLKVFGPLEQSAKTAIGRIKGPAIPPTGAHTKMSAELKEGLEFLRLGHDASSGFTDPEFTIHDRLR